MNTHQLSSNIAHELATNSDLAQLVSDCFAGKTLTVFQDTSGDRDFESEGIDIYPYVVVATDSQSGGRLKDDNYRVQILVVTKPAEDVTKPLSTTVNNLFTIPAYNSLISICEKINSILDHSNLGANYDGYTIDYDLVSQSPCQYAVIEAEFTELHSF